MTKPKGSALGGIIGAVVGVVFGFVVSIYQHMGDVRLGYLFAGLVICGVLGWKAGGFIASGKE